MAGVEEHAAIIAAQARRIAALERAAAQGLTMRAPNGTRWRIVVGNTGTLTTVPVA
jgi:hypothetical protein